MLRPMDLWRCAILRQTAPDILRNGLSAEGIVWLPETGRDTFRADPFGLWRDGKLHVFVEAFGYATRAGHIEVLVYDAALTLLESRVVLRRPWHLSYPFVFEAEGDTWMLPEAYRSGTLTLYRSRKFPFEWEPACDLPLDGPAIDATPLFFAGRWWLFYTPSLNKAARLSHLHVAWAERLTGPWQVHPKNPVRIDIFGARPGGVPWCDGSAVILPVQDCAATYGAAVSPLRIERLDDRGFVASRGAALAAPAFMAPFTDGLHTLSAAGQVTLLDVKRMDASLPAKWRRLDGIVRQHASRIFGVGS